MDLSEIQAIKRKFGIIGNSSKLNYAIQVAVQVAPTDLTVLISGESGSGKESFSKIIHQLSARKHGQFIAINCGAIPEGTMDSELFGHEKGSFTGATDSRKGYFEVTNGGTIFLDEIAELPLETQARLLRVLENKEFIRVGSSKVQKTDVRVVAATHKNLFERVESGKFREDLYYRLNTVPIAVPPLRERGDDIELLFRKFTTDFADKYHVKPLRLTEEAIDELMRYRFPGNIRQLKNLAEQISALEMERVIDGDKLRSYLPENETRALPAIFNKKERESENYSERDILYKVLFDLKNDVTEMKKLIAHLTQTGHINPEDLENHKNLFEDIPLNNEDINTNNRHASNYPPYSAQSGYFLEAPKTPATESGNKNTVNLDKIEDITHAMEDESLSLEKKEKELIIKALAKNKNKRKYAAKDLGISERTLYRKIKQYDIGE